MKKLLTKNHRKRAKFLSVAVCGLLCLGYWGVPGGIGRCPGTPGVPLHVWSGGQKSETPGKREKRENGKKFHRGL